MKKYKLIACETIINPNTGKCHDLEGLIYLDGCIIKPLTGESIDFNGEIEKIKKEYPDRNFTKYVIEEVE